ncbi:MAG: hypothetical protein ABIH36_02215 [bacterium]
MRKKDLSQALVSLRELGGYFVFKDEVGEEYVLLSKREFDGRQASDEPEVQLSLADAPKLETEARADYVLERINREIALYQLRQQEDEMAEMTDEEAEQLERGARVRFEPLRGDLPPELQE